MATTDIKLFCDVLNNTIVQGLDNGNPYQFGTLYQFGAYLIQLTPCLPNYTLRGNQFTKIPLANLVPKIGIGPRAGAEALLAAQFTWTPVFDAGGSGTGYFQAVLDLNTTEMNTAVGSSDGITTYLQLDISESGNNRTVLQQNVDVVASIFDPVSPGEIPVPEAGIYSRAEMDAIFVRWDNNLVASRGKNVVLYSPDGTALRIIGVRDDKSAIDDIV